MRSESGPQTQAPAATDRTRTETVRPAVDGATPNSLPSSGRIAWVEYMVANMPAAPNRNPHMPVRATRAILPLREKPRSLAVRRGAVGRTRHDRRNAGRDGIRREHEVGAGQRDLGDHRGLERQRAHVLRLEVMHVVVPAGA